eukprot:TRINITY_DN7530_c0_g1_i1.p1 TRINITY_DN7530_c0_g1~~TRINITY_DN7530_c0_g1_i1.p1  ORF type:complete len:446 (-),score=102.11 TRINITY_DN7530_c0_g1_i1:294-1631(-)
MASLSSLVCSNSSAHSVRGYTRAGPRTRSKQHTEIYGCSFSCHALDGLGRGMVVYFPMVFQIHSGRQTRFSPRLNISKNRRGGTKTIFCRVEEEAAGGGILSSTTSLDDEKIAPFVNFISEGPILEKVGLKSEDVGRELDIWQEYGLELSKQLGFDTNALTDSQKRRIFHYYLPTFFWCLGELQHHQKTQNPNSDSASLPLVIGISAPQGCGKTTVVESLEHLFRYSGRQAASISIDDFYLTRQEQASLAEANRGNLLLELRGNAGSHDLQLGTTTLKKLKALNKAGGSVKLPRYNKSAYGGKGDRADEETWPEVEAPLDVVLFEGWMLGFEPVGVPQATNVDPQLAAVDENLFKYSEWHQQVDSWIIIQVNDVSWVYQWRLQAEVQMRANGKPGMSDEEVADFVSRYIPAYRAYLPSLYKLGPSVADPLHTLALKIDQNRIPVE